MVDHLVFFAVREGASQRGRGSIDPRLEGRGPQHRRPLCVGKDFSGRSGGYTHALFARFEDAAGLREYIEHPAHLAVVERLDATTTGRIVVDYEF